MGAAEAVRLGRIIENRRQGRDGGEPLGPQTRHDATIGAERDENARACLTRRRDPQDRVRIKRQAGRRFAVAADIASAAAEFLVPARRVDRHRHAGFIPEAAEFHRIDGQPQRRRAARDRRHRLRHPFRQSTGEIGQLRRGQRGQGAVGGTGGQQQIGQHRCQRPAMAGYRGRILAVQRARQAGAIRPGQPGVVQQGRHQHRQGQVEADPGQADRRQRLGRDQHGLGVRLGAVVADQLDARLRDLPIRRELSAAHPQALPGIGQPQRPRRAGQPGGGDPRDLRRRVRPQAHHALAVRVHQAKGLVRHRHAGPGEQAVLELQQRRLDALIAVRGEHGHQRLDGRGLRLGVGRQQVAQAGGQQRRVRGKVVGHVRRQLSANGPPGNTCSAGGLPADHAQPGQADPEQCQTSRFRDVDGEDRRVQMLDRRHERDAAFDQARTVADAVQAGDRDGGSPPP